MTPRNKKKKAATPKADDAASSNATTAAAAGGAVEEEGVEVWRDRTLRAQAEMANMRRRLEQDVGERTRMRMEALFLDIITLTDHLDLALDAVPEELERTKGARPFLEGIRAIRNSMEGILEAHGLEKIHPAEDHEFDSEQHEAVRTETNPELEHAKLELVRRGYRMGRRILRPAQVVLWLPSSNENPEPTDDKSAKDEDAAD